MRSEQPRRQQKYRADRQQDNNRSRGAERNARANDDRKHRDHLRQPYASIIRTASKRKEHPYTEQRYRISNRFSEEPSHGNSEPRAQENAHGNDDKSSHRSRENAGQTDRSGHHHKRT